MWSTTGAMSTQPAHKNNNRTRVACCTRLIPRGHGWFMYIFVQYRNAREVYDIPDANQHSTARVKNTYILLCISWSLSAVDQGFPDPAGGVSIRFFQKLHEIEDVLGREGGGAPRSANVCYQERSMPCKRNCVKLNYFCSKGSRCWWRCISRTKA